MTTFQTGLLVVLTVTIVVEVLETIAEETRVEVEDGTTTGMGVDEATTTVVVVVAFDVVEEVVFSKGAVEEEDDDDDKTTAEEDEEEAR